MTTGIYAADAFAQTLKLADYLMPRVRSRSKTVTVRTGRRDVKVGGLMLESTNGTEGTCVVTVLRVSVTSLHDVPNWALAGEGLTSTQGLLEVLQRYYPTITMDSEITAIEFSYIGEAQSIVVTEKKAAA